MAFIPNIPVVAFSGNSIPGKFLPVTSSAYFTGNVVASLPLGFTLPLNTSATALPASRPGCHASNTASTLSFQLAVSITPPALIITITFLFFA